ncbi:MAG: virB8 family protein [Formosimonas sp.]
MMKKTTQSPAVEKAIKKSQNFEVTLADARRKSEKRAWWVAGVSTFVTLCTLGGLFYVLPLKEKVPYLVMADAYSGQASVARLAGDWKNTPLTATEAINKSNVSHFVVARESFDSALLNLRDWNTVFSMSAPEVSSEYRALLDAMNPNSPFVVYGKTESLRVKVMSIVLNGGDPARNITPTGATVRFQRFVYDKRSGGTRYLDNRIATLTFSYKSNLVLDEKYRIENPLGFQVASYRVDTDVSTAPAPGDVVPAATSDAAASVNGVPPASTASAPAAVGAAPVVTAPVSAAPPPAATNKPTTPSPVAGGAVK